MKLVFLLTASLHMLEIPLCAVVPGLDRITVKFVTHPILNYASEDLLIVACQGGLVT